MHRVILLSFPMRQIVKTGRGDHGRGNVFARLGPVGDQARLLIQAPWPGRIASGAFSM
jgi:hypothetical protein